VGEDKGLVEEWGKLCGFLCVYVRGISESDVSAGKDVFGFFVRMEFASFYLLLVRRLLSPLFICGGCFLPPLSSQSLHYFVVLSRGRARLLGLPFSVRFFVF
jgi:hypothetical protein